ncbi:Calx-beta domain-containing protein [Luteolibacter luteus]|uniref:Cadherin-like domain-containing protein n=1 Tax=Luteolibacter luteus TaxID=2728835 RepID=A0A858RQE2_9BACT|nr:Calx-beta domain-containing protein [Luteolibacter luteus]QJE98143.1 cadherin-like domain-containing protein [Luteolibacter luteus]
MKYHLGTLALLLPASAFAAPVELGRESFEGTPGSIGYTSSYTYDDGTSVTPICASVLNNGTRIKGPRTIAGGDGNRMFTAVRVNRVSAQVGDNAPGPLTLTTTAFPITGKINNSVKLLLSAPGDFVSGATDLNVYDFTDPTVNHERIRIEASIDGGAFTTLGQYSPSSATNGSLIYDADFDGLGGGTVPVGVPASLDATFQEASFSIPSGNSVQVRLTFFTNGSAEYVCFDNIRIFGETAATNPPAIGNVSVTPLSYAEGSGAQLIAPGLTLSDGDSSTLPSATVSISQNYLASEDVLTATPSGSIVAGDISYAGGVLTINRVATLADYQAVLASVRYQNTNTVNPSTATRHVTFATTDGTNTSNAPIRQISVVDLVPVQEMPFTESFETDGRGTRYSVLGGFSSGNSLFTRLVPTTAVPGTDGANVFAAERTQTDAEPLEAVTAHVNTANYTNLKLNLLAATQGGSVFEQLDDFLLIQTSVDGGAWETKYAFRSTAGASGNLALDTDLNGTGDGTALTSSFQDFSFDLPSATTLGVRIVAATDGNGERILFDNLRVTGDLYSYSIADASAQEDAGTISFDVTRSGSTSGGSSVNYSLTAGTASGGTDYQQVAGILTFEDGVSTLPVVVTITNDSTVELDETFTVNLDNPSPGIITDAEATGTILNDDSSVISLAGGTVAEGDSSAVNLPFTVSLTNPVDTAVTVSRQTLATGTAAAGTDFTALGAATLTIPAGQTTASFDVAVTGDNDVESDETVVASLSDLSASGRSVSLGTVEATGTITDDDPLLVAGNGSLAVKIGVSGKLKISDLLALTSIVEGRAVSLVSVQNLPTAQGGTVTIVDGWIYYQPPAGFSGADSFTFTITDGVQTVTGTVGIAASAESGASFNIVGQFTQGDDRLIVCLGISGRTYLLQTSEDLAVWTNSGSPQVCPANGAMLFTDVGPLPETRYYRVIEAQLPPP